MLKSTRVSLTLLVLTSCFGAMAANQSAHGAPAGQRRVALASIVGTVYDHRGQPLAGALIAIIRADADQIIKQAITGADGKFSARIAAGRYSLRAVADGFNAASFDAVQITPAAELVYRFNLEPIGTGRNAPERRRDRNDAKWGLRAAQSQRSIFQAQEGENSAINTAADARETTLDDDDLIADAETDDAVDSSAHRARTLRGVIETYGAVSSNPFASHYTGTNFALAQNISGDVDLIFAGQYGAGVGAPQRFETIARVRLPGDKHRLNLSAGGVRFSRKGGGALSPTNAADENLGQISLRALDEWNVRDGVVVVLGVDYSRLTGAGDQNSFTPQIGFQYDLDARTRLRAAYTPGAALEGAQSFAQFEDGRVAFKAPDERTAGGGVYAVDARGRALLERSRRMELGVERILDAHSSVEATAFFDTVSNRGVGLMSMPLTAFANSEGEGLWRVVNQQGDTRGLRAIYTRRLNAALKASAGYSFGRGQQLSSLAAQSTAPANLLRNGFFQTLAAELDAQLSSRTQIRTVFRFSPSATVFAIDPFAGRLAIYDPSLSIYVTQELPTFGLPVRAEAIFDARNLLDVQTNAIDENENTMVVGAMRRSLRGGISVRF